MKKRNKWQERQELGDIATPNVTDDKIHKEKKKLQEVIDRMKRLTSSPDAQN